jgi:hypothetical protein
MTNDHGLRGVSERPSPERLKEFGAMGGEWKRESAAAQGVDRTWDGRL